MSEIVGFFERLSTLQHEGEPLHVFAARCRVSPQTMRQWEIKSLAGVGGITWKMVAHVAGALDVRAAWLMCGEEPRCVAADASADVDKGDNAKGGVDTGGTP